MGSTSLSSHRPDENWSWNIKFHFCAIRFLIGKSLCSNGCRLLPEALNHVPRLTKPRTDPQKPSDRQHTESCHKTSQNIHPRRQHSQTCVYSEYPGELTPESSCILGNQHPHNGEVLDSCLGGTVDSSLQLGSRDPWKAAYPTRPLPASHPSWCGPSPCKTETGVEGWLWPFGGWIEEEAGRAKGRLVWKPHLQY